MDTLKSMFDSWLAQLDIAMPYSKVKHDFVSYLELDREKKCVVYAVGDDRGTIAIDISIEDDVTILCRKVVFPHRELVYIPIEVQIGIGSFAVESSIYTVEKCSAVMLYNQEFELVDIDFYYNQIHRKDHPE